MTYIDIVFDGPPSRESGRFVEVEDAAGKSIKAGQWIKRGDGYWALRLPQAGPLVDLLEAACARVELANAEGNPILSGWLPDARRAIAQAKAAGIKVPS